MEVVVVVTALGALAFLATRYGYDSRDTYRSSEEQLAVWGLSWENLRTRPRPPDVQADRPSPRVRWIRERLAAGVTWLANWLDPTAVASAS